MTRKGATMPELMLVGVGRMGRPYVNAAKRLGLRVSAVEAATRLDAVAAALDDVRPCRGEVDELWVEAASAAIRTRRPDAVIAFSEPHVMAAALVQDSLGLQGPSLHAAVLSRNKGLQRAHFAAEGVRQPDYVVTESLAHGLDWAATRLPVVIKPLSRAGSEGVELVSDLDGYRAAARRRAGEGPLLVETTIEGPEYSWEAIVCDGEVAFANTTAKETTGPPHFVEVTHRTGVQLDADAAAQVEWLAEGVLRGLRMRTGLVHLEFRMAQDGPTLMEVAVRTPGDFLMELVNLTYGIDLFELVVRASLSLPLPPLPRRPVRYAASYLPIAQPGFVSEVRGLREVLAHPCVVRAELTLDEGDVVAPTRSSAHRAGHVLLAADTPEELESALAFVRETLEIRTQEQVTP
jgi:biotin carboxylase